MKHVYTIIISAVLLMTLSSCDDFLDIYPDGQVKREEILSTTDGIEDALYGVYAQLREGVLYGQVLTIGDMEILGQNMDCYGNTRYTNLGAYKFNSTDVEDIFKAVWESMYKNISNANSVLAAEKVANATEFPYTIYKGEALALRAFMHFDLVRLYLPQYTQKPDADGIPYQTEFSLNTPEFESMAKNYQHILADLLEAEKLLADEGEHTSEETLFMADRQIHINLYAVKALIARVYMTMGNREMALKYAQDVIENSPYRLKEKTEVMDDVAGVLSKKECIFGVYFSDFFTRANSLLQQTTSYSSLDPRSDFMERYNENMDGQDYRITAYFSSIEQGGVVKYRVSKFTDIYELRNMASSRPKDLILGINLVRIPEMYYICAECLLNTDLAKAQEYFDAVLEHRGLEPLSNRLTGNVLTQELINADRWKEYFGEGQTYFEYKRQHLDILSCDGTVTYKASNDIYEIPIPDEEYANRY